MARAATLIGAVSRNRVDESILKRMRLSVSRNGAVWQVHTDRSCVFALLAPKHAAAIAHSGGMAAAASGFIANSAGDDAAFILDCYRNYGQRFPASLNGEFVALVRNTERKTLFVATDSRGLKPVYYARAGDTLYFATAIKPLLSVLSYTLNARTVRDFLVYGCARDSATFFNEVQRLPASSLLCYDRRLRMFRYKRNNRAEPSALFSLLRESAAARAAEGAGVLLSGGIDSSALVAALAESHDVHTYTVGYEHESVSELPYARLVADAFGTRHTEILLRSSITKTAPEVVSHLEEPLRNPAALISYQLSRRSQGEDVLLSGDGAEQMFDGTNDYLIARHYGMIKPFLPLIRLLPPKSDMFRTLRVLDERTLYPALNGMFLPHAGILSSLPPGTPHSDYHATAFECWITNYLPYREKTFLPHNHAVSYPFLDERMVAFAAQLPDRYKLRLATTKYILRKSCEGRIPQVIIRRNKMPFPSPSRLWADEQTDAIIPVIERLGNRSLFPPHELERFLTEYDMYPKYDFKLWSLFFLEMFLEQFIDSPYK